MLIFADAIYAIFAAAFADVAAILRQMIAFHATLLCRRDADGVLRYAARLPLTPRR
jgi:hypothetical protein